MRQSIVLGSSALTVLLLASTAHAADWYVSPTGTASTGCSTRSNPCSLSAAASGAVAGDNVILMDGVYNEPLYVANSGTSAAWITFKADQCATPIIEGEGVGPTADNQDNGVGSTTAEYVKFVGIVSRGWNIGFGNGWAGGVDSNEESNGHWEIEYCVSYSNGRTGFTFFSAEGFKLKNSISAHNGSSQLHSWSSGVTLFEAHGSNNVVEGNISFENTDAERNTDGSGFIVDEESNGATFINNLAFRNAGSCLRLTRSSGTKFINNTCFHNSQFGSRATGPTNPGEIYFTNGGVTQQNVLFMNNVIVGTGVAPAGSTPIQNQPSSGWTDNVVTTGSVNYFTAPTGTNPDFTPASGATNLIGQGTTGMGAPSNDLGFDPKCIVKRTPVMVGQVARESWWEYDIDIDYIKSIGGVAQCFNPQARAGNDIGAYKAGAVMTAPECEPPVIDPGTGGMGGMAGTGGLAGAAGDAGAAAGGMAGSGGDAAGGAGGSFAGAGGDPGAGGLAAGAGGDAVGGTAGTAGASLGGATSGGTAGTGVAGTGVTAGAAGGVAGGAGGAGGASAGATGVAGSVASGGATGSQPPAETEPGCSCTVVPRSSGASYFWWLGLAGLAALAFGRRRHSR